MSLRETAADLNRKAMIASIRLFYLMPAHWQALLVEGQSVDDVMLKHMQRSADRKEGIRPAPETALKTDWPLNPRLDFAPPSL